VAVGRAYPLAPRFLWECLNSPSMTRFLGPAHRTERAVFPHPALGLVSRQGMRARHPPAVPRPHEAKLPAPPQRSRWLNAARGPCVVTLGLDVELPLERPDLLWSCQEVNLLSSAPSEAPRTRATSLHRRYPVSLVLLAPPTPTPARPPAERLRVSDSLILVGLPCCDAFCLHVPPPLPRRVIRSLGGCPRSGYGGLPRVRGGSALATAACSGFTRVAARRFAGLPCEGWCPGGSTTPVTQGPPTRSYEAVPPTASAGLAPARTRHLSRRTLTTELRRAVYRVAFSSLLGAPLDVRLCPRADGNADPAERVQYARSSLCSFPCGASARRRIKEVVTVFVACPVVTGCCQAGASINTYATVAATRLPYGCARWQRSIGEHSVQPDG